MTDRTSHRCDLLPRLPWPAALITSALLLALAPDSPRADPLTASSCRADNRELIVAIEDIRKAALKEIDQQIADTQNHQTLSGLRAMRETVWEDEERQLGQAQHILYDCLKAAVPRK